MLKPLFVEHPNDSWNDIEFFLQHNKDNRVTCPAHIHQAVELIYVEKGSYSVIIDDTHYTINKGDLILFCSGAIHYAVTNECKENSYYVLKISPSFFINLARITTGEEYAMRFALNRKEYKCHWTADELEGSEMKRIIDSLIKELTEEGYYAQDIAVNIKAMELLLAILRQDAPKDRLENNPITQIVYSAMSYVRENFTEDIDENELAKSYGISYSYFSRSFKRITGMTFKKYLNRTRISKAEQMLFQSDCSVSDAATACGFNSISYFIKVFRQITGKTPHKSFKLNVSDK